MLRQVRCECGYITRGRSDYEVIALYWPMSPETSIRRKRQHSRHPHK
jgi:hypothetical protein